MSANLTLAGALLVLLPIQSALAQSSQPAPRQPGQTQPSGITSLPNTVSAHPLTIGDKLDYRVVQSIGLRGALGASVSAAIGQAANSPHEWGQGVQGFAERFGSAFAGNLSRQTFSFALESVLHEDPRYFPSEHDSKKERIVNALKQVIICKTDSGKSSFAYGRVVSAFGAGQFANVWQPESTGGVGNGIKRGFISLGGDFAYNMMQEFIPFTRPRSLRHHH
jgi:hypothetical protein